MNQLDYSRYPTADLLTEANLILGGTPASRQRDLVSALTRRLAEMSGAMQLNTDLIVMLREARTLCAARLQSFRDAVGTLSAPVSEAILNTVAAGEGDKHYCDWLEAATAFNVAPEVNIKRLHGKWIARRGTSYLLDDGSCANPLQVTPESHIAHFPTPDHALAACIRVGWMTPQPVLPAK